MKHVVVIATALLLWAVPSPAQQPDPKEFGPMLGNRFGELSGWILKAAEMVPADKYSYKPAATVRTFGELLGHIADGSNYFFRVADVIATTNNRVVEIIDTVPSGTPRRFYKLVTPRMP